MIIGSIAEPPDAVKCWPWDTEWCEDRAWSRAFESAERTVGDVTVVIPGRQYADGSTERELNLSCGDDFLDAAGARHLAAALIAAAEHMGRAQCHRPWEWVGASRMRWMKASRP